MKKIYIKIALDIIMAVILLSLTRIKITGMFWHEVLGIVILGIFIIHIWSNLKTFKAMHKGMTNKKLTGKAKFSHCLNGILFLLALIAVITGILISYTILTNITIANRDTIAIVHRLSAGLLFIGVIIHIALHRKHIRGKVGKAIGQ